MGGDQVAKTADDSMDHRDGGRADEGFAGALSALGAVDRLLAREGLIVALVVAWVATLGSLYFSEVARFIPCRLCWFQRIFMYPLAFILPIAILRRDRAAATYVLPLAVVGGGVSTYHVLLQKTDLITESAACSVAAPCSAQYINWFGFVSIPVLALLAFGLIILATSATLGWDEPPTAPNGRPDRAWKTVLAIALPILLVFAALWWRGW